MKMKKRAEPTFGLLHAAMAACVMLLVGFGVQAFAASHFGLMGADTVKPGASGLPFPGADGKWISTGLEAAAHPATAGQSAPNPASEIGPVIPSSNDSGARSSAWMTVGRILLVLAFLGAIVIVGFVAVKIIRNRRTPDAQ